MTIPNSMLEIPLYARKPQRRVPGTNVVAVTTYKSEDGTVQTVTLITEDGQTMIGRLHYQHRRTMTRSRGWSLYQSPTSAQYMDQWPTLAEAAVALAERLDCSDKVVTR